MYEELIKDLRDNAEWAEANIYDVPIMLPDTLRAAAAALEDIANLRNFACQLCGKYKQAHEGSCDGCRWKKGE